MRIPNRTQGSRGARLSHPVLALLIAAIAAIGAISQCGLLLDEANTSRGAARASTQAMSSTPTGRVEHPRVASAQGAVPSPVAARPN